jgi:AcrR family transcriptional regulator
MPTTALDETARHILDAASRRFLHYGFAKTTMSEIAGDCNMSTGNLYRYFPSKLDIAETFVRVLRAEQIALLRDAAGSPALRAQERLRNVLHAKFKIAYDRFHDRPKAFELATEVLMARPEVAIEWEAAEGVILDEILQDGAGRAEFPAPAPRMARLIQDVVYRFTTPAVFHEGDFDQLAGELEALIQLILDALAWRLRRSGPAPAMGADL